MTNPRPADPVTPDAKPRSQRRLVVTAVLIALCIIVSLLLIYICTPWWRPVPLDKVGNEPDAAVLISTYILIYTFFIAAFGGIVPALVEDGTVGRWQLVALAFMFPVVGLDLYRVLNSAGDLYVTTMRSLVPSAILDASFEFGIYFLVNVVVVLLALVIILLVRPSGSREVQTGVERGRSLDPRDEPNGTAAG